MAILKKEYELSVWKETLGENGQKIETKQMIIGAHDMEYLGRATNIKLQRKINGTNALSFQLPSKYFDSRLGEYIHNEFCDHLFNECKLKLKYRNEWYEFFIKSVQESKQFKSIMYQYNCQDAFIDELSRNGYGIAFDTELYNNVEEIGVFTNEILEDSTTWKYDASKNIGDFTEYSEEKLFKIPVSYFTKICGYKLKYKIDNEYLINVYTDQERNLEMGDDKASELKYFWDNGDFDKGFSLISEDNFIENIPNDGYIYIPYNQLNFCYIDDENSEDNYEATQTPSIINDSYAIAPTSIDPSKLIQFIAIPKGAEVIIDEAGLLVNKDYNYVMTIAQWNENVVQSNFYRFEDVDKKELTTTEDLIHGNWAIGYEGYLEEINDIEVNFGKAISISDRTEINISEEIDQYITVYNNNSKDFKGMYTLPDEDWTGNKDDWRVCSKTDTRQIIPQLARNLIQNGSEISSLDGWEIMKLSDNLEDTNATIKIVNNGEEAETSSIEFQSWLEFTPAEITTETSAEFNTLINFGIVGQEKQVEVDKTYFLQIDAENISEIIVMIGEGSLNDSGDYSIDSPKNLEISTGVPYLIRFTNKIKNPYIAIHSNNGYKLKKAQFFEAYTKGVDFFEGAYFRYSGRDIGTALFTKKDDFQEITEDTVGINAKDAILFETDIMEGDTYGYQRYFIQQLQLKGGDKAYDTFAAKKYLDDDAIDDGALPLPANKYTEDDYKIVTNYIDLNKCKNYNGSVVSSSAPDCSHEKNKSGVCMYQKYGYCPYLFKTQKHCRKIRTLNGKKSNRFNLTQELSKVFEVYPVYYIEHEDNGKATTEIIASENFVFNYAGVEKNISVGDIISLEQYVTFSEVEKNKCYERMKKSVFYMTEKGMENKLGFRYEKNLSNISRTLDSNQIVTKLYVEDVDSELSKTGLCSIKTAEDNPSKDSFIIDFSYYILKGLLDKKRTNNDLYGKNNEDLGFLKQLGYYNGEYDKLSNKIINLQDSSYTELEANIEVNLTGIESALQELQKIKKKMSAYRSNKEESTSFEENDTYKNYQTQQYELEATLYGLIKDTFYNSQGHCTTVHLTKEGEYEYLDHVNSHLSVQNYLDSSISYKELSDFLKKEKPIEFKNFGMIGQYLTEYHQIQEWKKERSTYLKQINKLSLRFYQKYEAFLKEGTWSDSNYLSDNSYYFGAKEVAKQGAIPKITYAFNAIDLEILDEDYEINIADTTYVEDIETFGINIKTGLPNRLKVIISGITYDLDAPSSISFEIQNYTTQFEDLFSQVSASVQSLSFNENIYKRSSNFTATKNVEGDSLQGALNENQLTLLETDEKNIEFDYSGQSGSDINNHNNKYKLNGQGLFFSNDGGQHWNTGVGPSGINADYIKVGTLDAGRIRIVDNNYLYFLWDKTGITAYREPQRINDGSGETKVVSSFEDFARFNKYGLSLAENNIIRLRAGYEFNGTNGNISSENSLGDHIGFYLYDEAGNTIFKTEAEENSARLSLQGEIKATDNLEEKTEDYYIYTDGKGYLQEETVDKYEIYENSEVLGAQMITGYEENGTPILDDITFEEYYQGIENNEDVSSEEQIFYISDSNEYVFSRIDRIEKKKAWIENSPKKINIATIYINRTEDSEGTAENAYESLSVAVMNGQYYINSGYETESFYIKIDTENDEYSTNKKINFRTYKYYEEENENYTEKEINGYGVEQNNIIYLYNSEETVEGTLVEGNVIVYMNNQAGFQIENDSEGYSRRIFSCVKISENEKDNLFSVLSDGSLYIGGTIEERTTDNVGNDIDDFIKIKVDSNTITLNKNGIQIGTEDLTQGIIDLLQGDIDALRQQIASTGLIEHSHIIPALPVFATKDIGGTFDCKRIKVIGTVNGNGELNAKLDASEYSLSNEAVQEGSIMIWAKIDGMYGESYAPLTISIEEFIKQIELYTKEGEKTQSTGTESIVSSSAYVIRGE